jgi:integrase
MTVSSMLDSAGRRRSPATLPGFHSGRAPRNKGMLYPADPPTVEEIVGVMRHASEDPHGWRLRAMIVVLWRGGLRVQEALGLSEQDLDLRRGSVLVRRGQGRSSARGWHGRVGLGEPAALARRARRAPGGPAVLRDRRPYSRSALVSCRGPHRVSPARRRGRRQAPLRAAPAAPRARGRARPRGRVGERHPAPARSRQSRHHQHLPAGIDIEEIISTVHARQAPMMSATAGLQL